MLSFGIEIEFIVPHSETQGTIAEAIERAGVPCYAAGYSHALDRFRWKIVSDGSLNGGNGMELVSPPLFVPDQVSTVCQVLAGKGATVNRSCGLHVHIGARDLPVPALKKLAALYIEHEDLIDSLLPPSRRGNANTYLKSLKSAANIELLASATTVESLGVALTNNPRFRGGPEAQSYRYSKLNFMSYWKHGTVEFRHHSGTIDAAKIIRWVTFCSKMVEAASRDANEPIRTPGAALGFGNQAYWRNGKSKKILFQMLQRPEGVTGIELARELGIRSRPNIRWHLIRAGAPTTANGMRGGYEVFRLERDLPSAEMPAPVSLDGLYDKLGLSDEDKAFWMERAAYLGTGVGAIMDPAESGRAATVSNTLRRHSIMTGR